MLHRFVSLLLLAIGLAGCAGSKDYRVKGAELIDSKKATADVVFEVLAYPLTNDELSYFFESLPKVEAEASARSVTWRAIQDADNPIQALRRHRAWLASGVSCEDFLAAFIKVNFIYEYLAEPASSEDSETNLEELERKISMGKADPELKQAAQSAKYMQDVIDRFQKAGAFDLYRAHESAAEQAVYRFKTIGER